MFSAKTKKNFILWTAILLTIYFVSFGLLLVHKFQLWILSPFVESQIAVFMSAGAIAIITGIILIFQSSVDSEQKKKQEVFKKKMELYSKVINKMNSIRLSRKVTVDDQSEILSMCSNIALLSNLDTFSEFNTFAMDLADEEGNILEDYPRKLMKFVIQARNDLDVHGKMTNEEEEKLEKITTESQDVIKEYFKPYDKKVFENINEMIKHLTENKKLTPKTEEILLYVYKHLNKNKDENFEFKDNFTPSYLGIRRDDRIYLRIKTTQKEVRIEHLKEGACKNFLENQKIEVNQMTEARWKKKGLYFVKFDKLEDFKKCQDKIVEYLNLR